jgi:hypothetical protein
VHPAFNDPAAHPTPELIHSALGSSADVWDELVGLLTDAGATVGWRHYRDGGWLAKASRCGKTVAWLSVEDGFARCTFYFAERHRQVLAHAPGICDALRSRIAGVPLTGRLLPVPLEVRGAEDTAQVRAVLAVKLTAK